MPPVWRAERVAVSHSLGQQLIDLAMLVETDFNEGIQGIGPKKALKLVRDFGSIENMPAEIRDGIRTAALERAFQ